MKHIKLFNESFFDNEKMEWQKNWEIVSFRYKFFKDDYKIITKSDPEFKDCLEDCLESEWREDIVEIYSVKRKSDGEIFTIGDELFDGYKRYGENLEISKIWTSFEQMRADLGNGGGIVLHDFFTVYKK